MYDINLAILMRSQMLERDSNVDANTQSTALAQSHVKTFWVQRKVMRCERNDANPMAVPNFGQKNHFQGGLDGSSEKTRKKNSQSRKNAIENIAEKFAGKFSKKCRRNDRVVIG